MLVLVKSYCPALYQMYLHVRSFGSKSLSSNASVRIHVALVRCVCVWGTHTHAHTLPLCTRLSLCPAAGEFGRNMVDAGKKSLLPSYPPFLKAGSWNGLLVLIKTTWRLTLYFQQKCKQRKITGSKMYKRYTQVRFTLDWKCLDVLTTLTM